jgi:glutamate 5-kinase
MPKRIVVKLGTSTLTAGGPKLSPRRMLDIASQVMTLREQGHEVILVSSGAMAAGRERLGLATADRPRKPARQMPYKQMLAAVGQAHLMMAWEQVFGMFETAVAQVLLTREDLADRQRYLNARNTLDAILEHGIVPVINENDAITTIEIKIGDNDNLSALVASFARADMLVILSDIDGLYTADPRNDPDATLVSRVEVIDERLLASAGASKTGLGTGGMLTKLQAAELAMRNGVETFLGNGARPGIITGAVAGTAVGTRFAPATDPAQGRKRWLLGERPGGAVIVDAGAARALLSGRSLLAVGVRDVQGDFDASSVIAIRDAQGQDVARGVARYNSITARRLLGRSTRDAKDLLGEDADATLVHADELVLL